MKSNKIDYVGYLGLIFIVIAYVFLYKNLQAYFFFFNILGTACFILYSYLIKSQPFFIGNMFILFMLIGKFLKF